MPCTTLQITHFSLQNALEILSEGPKIQNFPAKLASIAHACNACVNASATPILAVRFLPDHLKFHGYGPVMPKNGDTDIDMYM